MHPNHSKQNITHNSQNLITRIWTFIQENGKHVANAAITIALFIAVVFTFAVDGDLKSQALAAATLPIEEQVSEPKAVQQTPVAEVSTVAKQEEEAKPAPEAKDKSKAEVDSEIKSGRIIGSGHASYYGSEFAGRLTANGETFNPSAMTAAHKTLPFGSRVKVTNMANGKSVVVRVNDRGPFVAGRLIDVSKGAAQRLGMLNSGTAQVELELLG